MVTLALIAAGAGVVVWLVDTALRPWKRHRPCKGTGKVRVRGNRYDECRGCDGGRKPQGLRVAARLVRPDLARKAK